MRTRGSRTWIVVVTLTLVGGLVGQGTSWLLARSLLGDALTRPGPAALATAAPSAPPDPCALLDDNRLFDSALHVTCAGEPPMPPSPAIDHEAPAIPCEGPLRLVGTVVPRGHEERAFAAIVDATGASLLYALRMQVSERTVVDIRPGGVALESADGTQCTLSLFEHPGPALATLGIPPTVDDEIRASAPNAFHVARSLVERVISSGELLTTLRAIPHEDAHGVTDGVRVFGVRAGSVPARLGIVNGDLLTSVNGYSLGDPAAAIDAFGALRQARSITIHGSRAGAPLTIAYEVD